MILDDQQWELGKQYKAYQIRLAKHYLRYTKNVLNLSDKSPSVRCWEKDLRKWQNVSIEQCALMAIKTKFTPTNKYMEEETDDVETKPESPEPTIESKPVEKKRTPRKESKPKQRKSKPKQPKTNNARQRKIRLSDLI